MNRREFLKTFPLTFAWVLLPPIKCSFAKGNVVGWCLPLNLSHNPSFYKNKIFIPIIK